MWYSLFVVYALTDNVFTRERIFMIKSNIYKFLTIICLFSLPYKALASDNPGVRLDDSWVNASGNDSSANSRVDVMTASLDQFDEAHEDGADGSSHGSSGTSGSGSPFASNLTPDTLSHSDGESDYTFLESLDLFAEKHPHIVALGALTGTTIVLYKTNKTFRTKCDAVYARVQAAWKKQKEKPLSHGFLLKSATALSLLYSAKKLGLAPVIPSTFKYLVRWAKRMSRSRKCQWAAGLATATVGGHMLYKSFTQKNTKKA
jgi:hypothetical protein